MTYESMTDAELQTLQRQWGMGKVLYPPTTYQPLEEASIVVVGLPHHRQVPVINRSTLSIWIGAAVVMLAFWTIVWKLCRMAMH
jgi:hypothetical protein